MHPAPRSTFIAAALVLTAAAPAAAQVHVYFEPNIGVFFYDEAALDFLRGEGDPEDAFQVDASRFLGAKLGVQVLNRLAIEGTLGFASLTAQTDNASQIDADEIDGDLSLYEIGARLTLTPNSPLDLFLTGGVGGATTDFDLQEVESFSDVVVTVGGGLSFPLNDWVRLRGDVRSIVEFCEEADETDFDEFGECLDDSALTHTEVSGGAQLTIF